MEDNLTQVELFSNYQCSPREGGYSLLVFYATRVGIPILLPSSLLRRCNHGAGRSAHVDQCRNTRRKPEGPALHRGDWPADHLRLVSSSAYLRPLAAQRYV